MQLIITDLGTRRARSIQLTGMTLALYSIVLVALVAALAIGIYRSVFVSGSIQNWPLVGRLVEVPADHAVQNSRYVRENLDVLATKVGEMQVKMDTLDDLASRVSQQTGVKPSVSPTPGTGGALVGSNPPNMRELDEMLAQLDEVTNARLNYFAQIESRLFDEKIRKMMVPTEQPIVGAELGSPFGWRRDPFTGRSAMHTGLDFAGSVGTPIRAAAGGVVVTNEWHNAYGNMVEIDHGNNLVTRYAHTSRVLVKKGDLVTRGHVIAEVGSTGRSTGPHLHFEVLLQGVQQDPWPFLRAGNELGAHTDQHQAKTAQN